jgi:5-methylcytosine-specific restriction endonuclease McrA
VKRKEKEVMNVAVLVLNANWLPLGKITVRRALCLVLTHHAEAVVADTQKLWRSQYLAIPEPRVIRLLKVIKVPRRFLPFNRKNLFRRDAYTCQYCGRQPGKSQLTVDHIVPQARGGETNWENCVTACKSCNQRKGKRTLAETGMTLIRQPRQPQYVALLWTEARQEFDLPW